ncbi:Hypothetical protein GLP15_1699 [Giardia lamblia P15]|uniref:BZIP domain-containing protein n=1 Tax=Giardia intestinalis (strain P15) TaxID=658858 RepID=E1EW18_GIAIA|nr:Hypothetical protein GLP15_1699 [Giardia lamblia P15]
MTLSFTFDPSLGISSELGRAGSPQQPYYGHLASDPGPGVWGPEPYKCKPDLDTDKRKESGRLAAKRYRERVKEDQMLLKEDLQKLREDNLRLREENATLQKILNVHIEKILRSIDGILLFIKMVSRSRNADCNTLNQDTLIVATQNPECSMRPGGNYYGDNYACDNYFNVPLQLPLNDDVLPLPPPSDSAYPQGTYDSGSVAATDTYTGFGSSGSFPTASDSHSTYNVFVFILILLLPVKFFPYIISGYASAKSASRSAEVLSMMSLQANLRVPDTLGHKPTVLNYSGYSTIADYSVLRTTANDLRPESHQSALIPMTDAQIQVSSEASNSLFQLWERSSLASSQSTSLSLANINKTDLCQYYNTQDPGAWNSMVEVIESELKRTCSVTNDDKRLNDFIVEASDSS